jgi:hypothetical protein
MTFSVNLFILVSTGAIVELEGVPNLESLLCTSQAMVATFYL